MVKARKTIPAIVMGAATLMLVACNDDHVYEYSVDVNSAEWTPTDTLFYPVHVDLKSSPYSLIDCYYPYCLSLVVRYEKVYPAPEVPLRIMLDKEYRVCLDLGDASSVPDGDTWGSLCTKEFDITRMIFSFPDSGNYVIKIWPEDTVKNVASLTAVLE